MSVQFVPRDSEARRRISQALDENIFVEAGAGTGKTSSLVERVLALVASGRATLDHLAAITFTEAAAAELRDRIRERLERATADGRPAQEEKQRCARALTDLDGAAIQTLHSFAGSLLRERPLEAGLPPAFDTMDEIAASLAFEEAWAAWLDVALGHEGLQPALRLALTLGLKLDDLRKVAGAFHADYDLLRDASLPDFDVQPAAAAALIAEAPELERLCACANDADGDLLALHVRQVVDVARRLDGLDHASAGAWRILADSLPLKATRGSQKNWAVDPETGVNGCKLLKETLAGLHEQACAELDLARRASLMPLLRALRDFVLGYAAERKRQGRAGFHDLLVWARDLLRDNIEVRDYFRERYTHVLLDEAQDTDPIQAEIAVFLAEEVSPGTTSQARPRDWSQAPLAPGKLFVVGDPKQSIYRFRRADIAVMLRFQELLTDEPVRLVQNFRSQRPVVDWVNHLFGAWMQGTGQATYTPIAHRWEPETRHAAPPSVWSLGGPVTAPSVVEVRRQEAAAIASLLGRVKAGEWPVLDREASEQAGRERFRPAQFKDICILLPQRTALRTLELALEDAAVPYRLEGASLVFATQEVRDLINCLRAIDDPADQVALVAALRSPAFACSDVDLLEFVEAGGSLDLRSEAGLAGPVAEALQALRCYHDQRLWTSPAALTERVVRERRLFEIAFAGHRPRERWRRYAFLVGQARAFAEAGGRSLRAFLQWVAGQEEEGARVTEVPVPEPDEDAVRVMTVHGAKGLEFPIVVLTGLNTRQAGRPNSVLFDQECGDVEVRVGSKDSGFRTAGYEAMAGREEELEAAEKVRLLYVAATRARDHLVVSLYRTEDDEKSQCALMMKHLEDAGHLWRPVTAEAGPVAIQPEGSKPVAAQTGQDRQAWLDERARLLAERSRPEAIAATALARVVKEESPGEDEPWRRGRAGTALGRAVHAVLQTIDLATGRDVDEASRAQAVAEGIPYRAAEVARLVRVALDSDAVRRALAAGRWWREVPVGAPVGEVVLEGFIDLLFEEPDGLVVVDYKTDALASEDEVEQAMDSYRLQAGAYALAIQTATWRHVKEVVFLFLHPKGEAFVQDLPAAIAETEGATLTSRGTSAASPGALPGEM